MLSKQHSRRKAAGPSANGGKFLTDLETMSSAFYANKPPSRLASSTASSRSKSVGKIPTQEPKRKPDNPKSRAKPPLEEDKKPSIWSWKGLRALTQARHHRLDCTFSLTVHSVAGLPPSLEGACLVVHWRRRDADQGTRPNRVSRGSAVFWDEMLFQSCSVYGSRSGPQHSVRYEARHFLLYVSIHGSPEVDLGKHRVDLTRLLPLKLEELEEDKCMRKWTTGFRLSGRASGATLNVTFGYNVAEKVSGGEQAGKMDEELEVVKDLHEVMPLTSSELCDSVNVLYQKLDEEACADSVGSKVEDDCFLSSPVGQCGVELLLMDDDRRQILTNECEMEEFSVVDIGIVESTEENPKQEEETFENAQDGGFKADLAFKVALDKDGSSRASIVLQNDEQPENICNYGKIEHSEVCAKESLMKELEAALSCASNLVHEVDSLDDDTDTMNAENDESDFRDCEAGKSLILDDFTESVANDFLVMLGIEYDSPIGLGSESEPESPRERLLREFERDALSNGGLLNFYDIESSLSFEYPLNMPKTETDAYETKMRASRMEDLETEALMREWGLNENTFQHSPVGDSSGFGSPIHVPPEGTMPLPPLAEGVGSFVQTRNGGFVRSMSPTLFENAKTGGSLIMQVSSPVVVPAEMGSSVMDILQGLASVGIEKLSVQANKLMPLEDITGMTIEQIAWQSAQSRKGLWRHDSQLEESEILQNTPKEQKGAKVKSHGTNSSRSHSSPTISDSEFVSLEDLAPLAMDKIEALSIEGLRIQSGMSHQGPPPNITSQSIGEFSALKGKTVELDGPIGLDGTCGLQLMDIKDNGLALAQEEALDGLMGLSLTLDEWMKLDSGEIDEDELASDRTSKILAAHHATSLEAFRGRSRGDKRRGRSRKYGLLGNNFTVALMVQLRDPLRNYESVGAPMLALVQVERVFSPPKPRIHGTVCMVRDAEEKEDEKIDEKRKDEVREVEVIPEYKITEVNVVGLKAEEGSKKKLWGSSVNQQQSGSRWLLANGMGKKNSKNQGMKSKSSGDALWSISSSRVGKARK